MLSQCFFKTTNENRTDALGNVTELTASQDDQSSSRPRDIRTRFYTLLHLSVAMAHPRLVVRLFERGYGVNTATPRGQTSLMFAT
jgi:hypothetical protein